MGYVIYDVETTGLRKGFDQILQFAAVHLDEELAVRGRFEVRCRLMPHIAPSPGALHVTGVDVRDLLRTDQPSHYEMMRVIDGQLRQWRPAVFLGFNSIRFDEEFLRQALYQCLLYPYLTNSGGCARADVLALARVVAALRPDVLTPHRDPDGRAVFRLADLARANGIAAPQAHVAAADVEITLALCRRLKDGAPDLWSRFIQFAQKSTAAAFIQDEDAFLLFQAFGDHCRERVLTRIGEHEQQANRQYCLDLSCDLDALAAMNDDDLTASFQERDGPLVVLKTNAAPLLCPIYDLPDGCLGALDVDEVERRVEALRQEPGFRVRLEAAARRAERTYPTPVHVEQQLYGYPLPGPQDEALMQRFHAAAWNERRQLIGRFGDPRFQQLARRLIYFERPDLFDGEQAERMARAVRQRLSSEEANPPWLTAPAARAELAGLLADEADGSRRDRLMALDEYLSRFCTAEEISGGS